MPHFRSFFNPKAYSRFLKRHLTERRLRLEKQRLEVEPNWRGVVCYPPGHYYSPLLDLEKLGPNDTNYPFDGAEWWENIDLRLPEQRAYYEELLERFPPPAWPKEKNDGFRYFTGNDCFILADAFTLSGIIQKEKPRRIIEVGSGFSSAVMLDTFRHAHMSVETTFVEPYPDRLYSLLSRDDRDLSTIHVDLVQKLPLSIFDQLEAQDILFLDSSHVAKVGSDVSFIFLRILPRLKPGVIIHFHDVFYPFTYPMGWIRQGWAWNEALFIRAFLIGNPQFEIMAFNCCIGTLFPEIFWERFPAFLENTGGSIWIRKVA